jgi:hypothetical protein
MRTYLQMRLEGLVSEFKEAFHSAVSSRSKEPKRAGLFASLTPDQQRRILSYSGPECSGDPALPTVKPRTKAS